MTRKPDKGDIWATKEAALQYAEIRLTDDEAKKHAAKILKNIDYAKDQYGQRFWDGAKEYFIN